ncbi:Dabb family protein [Planktomarina temperata]|nr:Dabb family protein [Planktomarina temperata]
MIRHIVLIRFRADVGEEKIAELFEELHEIEDELPGMIGITSGRSESPEKMERGYMHGFVADFRDWDGLQAYQDHPDHQAVGAKLTEHADRGKDGILCFDLAIVDDNS